MIPAYRTSTIKFGEWFTLPCGRRMTCLPALDAGDVGPDPKVLFARMGARDASSTLASVDCRLPTVTEYEELHRVAYHIEPVVLPTLEMSQDRVNNMMGREWCVIHDSRVAKLLPPSGPVANCGKHMAMGAPPGKMRIYGWWTAHARRYGVHNDYMIQTVSDFHDDMYTDYATTFHAVTL